MDTDDKTSILTTVEYLAFEVGGQSYAINISTVREIRGWTEPASMPATEPHIMGVINLRGEMLPLLDLAAKLGLETPEINERSVIIVVEAKAATVGLLVDSVSNIITPSHDDLKPPPEAVKNGDDCFVYALTLIEDKLTRILDLSALLNDHDNAVAQAS